MYKTLLLLFIVAAPWSAQAQGSEAWSLKKDKEGVKVFYRHTSDIYEIKLATSLKIPLSGLIQLFSEVEQYPKWGYKVAEARLLQRVSDT